jgi:hypothetical protein
MLGDCNDIYQDVNSGLLSRRLYDHYLRLRSSCLDYFEQLRQFHLYYDLLPAHTVLLGQSQLQGYMR